MSDILNVALHPCDSSTILNWMLWRWNLNPYAKLLVITHRADGEALVNRVRVAMAVTRGALKRERTRHYKHFGFRTDYGAWTIANGMEFDAVYIERFTHKVHILRESLAQHMDGEEIDGRH